jgi:acyl-homoserine lactone acylase PvdQ
MSFRIRTAAVAMIAVAGVACNTDRSPPRVALSLNVVGAGSVLITPGGATCTGTCNIKFVRGMALSLTAEPSGSSHFAGWTGACSGLGVCAVQMEGHRSVTATFAPVPIADGFRAFDDYGTFLNVLTPGQSACPAGGVVESCPDNFTDQLQMYENLAFTQPGQLATLADLVPAFYKTGAFVAADGAPPADAPFVSTTPVSAGGRSAVIRRDSFGVPHIHGETRADVMFGTGYATAQDRTFLMDALRYVGRGRQSDFLGGDPAGTMDAELAIKAGYDEAELQAQGDQLAIRFGVDGEQALTDVEHFVAGINAYLATIRNTPNLPVEYVALQLPLDDYTPRDVVAIATLVQAIFAVGGGSEHRQVMQLHELLAVTGNATVACQLWRDLRHFDDPEKPTSADDRFETQSPPTVDETACPFAGNFASKYPGAVLFDRGSYEARDPLTVEECFLVANPLLGQPACPDFGGSVVTESVSGGSAPAAQPTMLPYPGPAPAIDLNPLRELLPAPQITGLAEPPPLLLSEKTREEAIRGAHELVAAVNVALRFPDAMSNALLVTPDQTVDGRAIAVFGPQTGYFAPQLLLELSQHGGDIHSRGMTFAGLPYVVIGRGVDFAWSATSSGDDIIDVRVLKLCNTDGTSPTLESKAYVHKGVCKPMFERFDEWTAEYNAGTGPPPGLSIGKKITRHILRAEDYGPVFATATVNGQSVALAVQRSTYFGEVDSALPFVRTSRNQIFDPQSFYETFNLLTGTFNWFYVDAENIAYFNSGLLPIRAPGVHPDLPSWGDGRFDWKQAGTGRLNPDFDFANFLPLAAHPRQTNPAKGFMTSWNNAQAPGFWAAEHQGSYGPVHRSHKLDARLRAFQDDGRKHTPMTLVQIMEDAGTTDLRGQEILPAVFDVLDSPGPALTAAQQEAVDLLKDWVAGVKPTGGVCDPPDFGLGAMRRDCNGPGLDTESLSYDHRDAVILMDRWWNTMVEPVLPQIFSLEDTPNGNVMIEGRHDAPGPIGSGFISGYYGYLRRVLDMALDRSEHPYRQLKCAGTGALADCRAALLNSLDAALAMGGNPRPEEYDAIVHSPVGLAEVPHIHWVNRPTWQQVVQPTARRTPE